MMKKHIVSFLFISLLVSSLAFGMEHDREWGKQEESDSETNFNVNNNSLNNDNNDNSASSNLVKIVTNDNQTFEIEQKVASVSKAIGTQLALINESGQEAQVPEIEFTLLEGRDFRAIVPYLSIISLFKENKSELQAELIREFSEDLEYSTSFEKRAQLLNLANFLDVPELKSTLIKSFSHYLTSTQGLQEFLANPQLLNCVPQELIIEIKKKVRTNHLLVEFLKKYLEKNKIKKQILPSGSNNNEVRLGDVSPDGKQILKSGNDANVLLKDVETGEYIKILKGHRGVLYSGGFSPDGKYIVSGTEDGVIKLWDLNTGECLKTLEGHLYLKVGFSQDGKKILEHFMYKPYAWNVEDLYLFNPLSLPQLLIIICVVEAYKTGRLLNVNQSSHFETLEHGIQKVLREEFDPLSLKGKFFQFYNRF